MLLFLPAVVLCPERGGFCILTSRSAYGPLNHPGQKPKFHPRPAQREQTAAQARGEAEKILKVKQAEAEAQSKALQGEGVARQRQAIIQGLQASVEQFKTAVEGSTARDVMAMVLLTQYFDTLRDIGTLGKSNTILLPNQPGTVNDLLTQIMAGFEATKPNFDGNGHGVPSSLASSR